MLSGAWSFAGVGMGPSALSVQELSVAYDRKTIVRDVSLEVPRGGITVLLGANGCGKSTLLKCLARVLPAASGQVTLDGASVHGMPGRQLARRLALLPQGPIAPEGLTVEELVAQGRYPHQSLLRQWSPEDAAAVERALTATDLLDLRDRPVEALSGGQRQRCWIAMVLAQETDIILLDEPTTFLDLKVQVDLMVLLRRIAHQDGRTLLIVLHELNLAAAFADHLVLMKSGQIAAQGPVETTFTQEALAEVFGLDAAVLTDPGTGRPLCVPRVAPLAQAAEQAPEQAAE